MAEDAPGAGHDASLHRAGRSHSTGALVIGGDYRGLGVVRSLGRQGIPICVLNDSYRVATVSRYVKQCLPWPDGSEANQLEFLVDLAARRGFHGWTIFPTGDETAALLARHHAELSDRYVLTVPPWDELQWAYDKRLTYRLAADVGVSYPETRYPADRTALASLGCPFPAVLKPAFKENRNDLTYARAWRVDDLESLQAAYEAACTLLPPDLIMVQEFVPPQADASVSFAALCQDGRPLAWLTARRKRQYPRDFGRASTFVETADVPEVAEPARRLLGAFRYTGLIEVEFKRDPRDGHYKLLDLNPRVWGWHSIGSRAGVDFPFLLWEMLHGRSVPQVVGRPGVRWIRLSTDLLAIAQQLRDGDGLAGGIRQSLRDPLEFAVFAADDPLPALLDLPLQTLLVFRRKASRLLEADTRSRNVASELFRHVLRGS